MAFFNFRKKDNLSTEITEFENNSYECMDFHTFATKMLHNALSRIINDALIPVELTDKKSKSLMNIGHEFFNITDSNNKIYFTHNIIADQSLTLREIIILALYTQINIFKINIEGEYYYFEGAYTVGNNNFMIGSESYPVEKAYRINKPLHDKDLLLYAFKPLYIAYCQVELALAKKNKIFFKKNGLNHVIDGVSNDSFSTMVEQAKDVFKAFMDSGSIGGIIDAQDTFEVLSIDTAGITDATTLAYTELARLLGVPQAELLGQSPTGLNAGGTVQFQEINYEKRLKDVRKRLILPLLDGLGVTYIISGLTIEEKLGILENYATYGQTLQTFDDDLFTISKDLTLELVNGEKPDRA